MTALLLGLDVGTSAVKAAVVDDEGREVARARTPTPWRAVPTGAELDPDELLRAAVHAGAKALSTAPEGELAGIGVASMAETGVLLDAGGRPVLPSIAWHDTRGEEEARRLERDLPGFSARTGLPPSVLCTLVKYAWMRANRPEAARGARWLNVAEWIVRGLGGDEATELSLASRTGFYDLHERAPWAEALAWAEGPAGLAPEAVPAGTPMGRSTGAPLPAGAVLTVAGHDHLAAAVGAGATGEGDLLNSNGTAEAFVRTVAPLAPAAAVAAVAARLTVGWHAVPGRQALLGAVWGDPAPADVLERLGGPVEELEARAEEGADVMRRMEAVAGGPARRLVVTGGRASGAAARAVKRAYLGPFEHCPSISTGARGAALAAGRAARLWGADEMPGAVYEPSR